MPHQNVSKHIIDLLHTHDCVVIPDFGGFIVNYISADFQENSKTFSPPKRRLAFNEVLKFDDKLLSSYISIKENILREEAKKQILAFVADLRFQLNTSKVFSFGEIGFFKMSEEERLYFESNANYSFFDEGFGLNEIKIPLSSSPAIALELATSQIIEAQQSASFDQKYVQNPKPLDRAPIRPTSFGEVKRKRTLYQSKYISYLGIICLVFFVGYVLLKDNNDKSTVAKSSLNPAEQYISTDIETVVAKKDTAKIVIAAPVKDSTESPIVKLEELQEKKEEIVVANNNKYFLIVGAFATQKTANVLKSQFQAKGFSSVSLIFPRTKSEKYIKVAVASFNTQQEAYFNKASISKKIHQDVWVFKK